MTSNQVLLRSDGATSPDGRLFRFKVMDGKTYPPGLFVSLQTTDGQTRLGQIDANEVDRHGELTATGRVYATGDSPGRLSGKSTAFTSAAVSPADSELVERLNASVGAVLEVGQLTSVPGARARLMPRRFNRHTFWCGQSGSGKTYALGVLLEELLMHTELPLVVFDPNADFVRLAEVRDDAPPEQAEALARRTVRILRPGGQPGEKLRVKFTALGRSAKAAVLRLDPLIDRVEYNTLLHLEDILNTSEPGRLLPDLRAADDPARNDFALRIENLGLLSWDIWAGGERPATEIIDTRPNATVLDLGGFKFKEEPLVVALSVLDELWSRRSERRPVLLVIDEAHNLCSPDAETALEKAVLERIIQIAAEGRKYGLWLLLSTQRPSKVHQGIISQCDNLALMRMSSERDLAELATIFGFAPAALLAQSPMFRQGEALFAGGFVPVPSAVQMRQRLTHEGGLDVSVPLAPKPE
ncbi:MAG: ATP-binding protein [Propionibacteriaceae bacterium]|jgi:DNA helicase HerA-like ATPase|nr:ATP-binding protein [Propionibacteriaceae bacterium]